MSEKKIRVGRLATVGQQKSEMGRLYRAARSGSIKTEDALRLANILRGMVEATRLAEIEPRIAELEAKATAPADPPTPVYQVGQTPAFVPRAIQ